LKAVVDSL